jgi:hypothetical protein
VRQNLAVYLLTGKRPGMYDWENDSARFDADALVAGAADRTDEAPANRAAAASARPDRAADLAPEQLVDRLLSVTLAAPAHPARRDELVRFATQQTAPGGGGGGPPPARARRAHALDARAHHRTSRVPAGLNTPRTAPCTNPTPSADASSSARA